MTKPNNLNDLQREIVEKEKELIQLQEKKHNLFALLEEKLKKIEMLREEQDSLR